MARVTQIFTVVVATDLAIDATNNKKVTSATHTFVAADVGKYVNVTAGTGFTVAANQIASVTGGAAIGTKSFGATSSTGGTFSIPNRIASSQTLGDRLFCQMKTAGTGLGYVLYSNSGSIPSKANDPGADGVSSDIVMELPSAGTTYPGGTYSDPQPGGGNFEDMSAYWVDGTVNGDKIRVTYNKR